MVSTNQSSGKFRLEPIKDKSDDVLEVGLAGEDAEKRAFVVVLKLEKPQSVDWILESYKSGSRVILVDMRPMKTAKSKADDLKRAVDRLRIQVEKNGRIMQLEESWLLLLPNDIGLLD